LGNWNVIAYRLYNFDAGKAKDALKMISKENLAEAFVTKMIYDR